MSLIYLLIKASLWVIHKIECAAFALGKGIIIAFKNYTVQSILALIAILTAFLTVKHCKFGIFINYKETTINNDFKSPKKVVIDQRKEIKNPGGN